MRARFARLPLVLLAAMALGWGAPALPPSAKPEPVAKAVRQYALTSANDFPQRDPQDWRLLGSNDDGKTWTVLDVFSGRNPFPRVISRPASPPPCRRWR